jgi:hypothetical protein
LVNAALVALALVVLAIFMDHGALRPLFLAVAGFCAAAILITLAVALRRQDAKPF